MSEELSGPQVLQVTFNDYELQRPATTPVSFYAKVREMRLDPTISLARALCIAPILAANWSYEQQDDAPEGAQDLIQEMMTPLRNDLLRSGFFGCIDYGWQSYEKIFEVREDGFVHVKKLKALLPDITDILVDPVSGDFIGLRQDVTCNTNYTEPLNLPIEKCLLLNVDVEGSNWYGESVMKIVEKAYDQWVDSNASSARFDRKMAGSHWVIHYPIGESKVNGQLTDNFVIAKQIISRLESAGAVAVPRALAEHIDDLNGQAPDQWKIELLESSGGQTSFMDRLKYLDALKVRAFGLPERAVLEGQFGTKAEAEAHADIAVLNMELRHQLMTQSINRHVVNQVLAYNYGPQAKNKVYIQPAPIADLEKDWLKKIYEKIISDPNGFLTELDAIDMEALRDRVAIPMKPLMNIDLTPGPTVVDEYIEGDVWPTQSEPILTPSMDQTMLTSGLT